MAVSGSKFIKNNLKGGPTYGSYFFYRNDFPPILPFKQTWILD